MDPPIKTLQCLRLGGDVLDSSTVGTITATSIAPVTTASVDTKGDVNMIGSNPAVSTETVANPAVSIIDHIDLDKYEQKKKQQWVEITALCRRLQTHDTQSSNQHHGRIQQMKVFKQIYSKYACNITEETVWQYIFRQYNRVIRSSSYLQHDIRYQMHAVFMLAKYTNFQCKKLKNYRQFKVRHEVYAVRDNILQLMDSLLFKCLTQKVMVLLKTDMVPENAFLVVQLCEQLRDEIITTVQQTSDLHISLLNATLLLFNRWRHLMFHPVDIENFYQRTGPTLEQLDAHRTRLLAADENTVLFYKKFSRNFREMSARDLCARPVVTRVIDKFIEAHIAQSSLEECSIVSWQQSTVTPEAVAGSIVMACNKEETTTTTINTTSPQPSASKLPSCNIPVHSHNNNDSNDSSSSSIVNNNNSIVTLESIIDTDSQQNSTNSDDSVATTQVVGRIALINISKLTIGDADANGALMDTDNSIAKRKCSLESIQQSAVCGAAVVADVVPIATETAIVSAVRSPAALESFAVAKVTAPKSPECVGFIVADESVKTEPLTAEPLPPTKVTAAASKPLPKRQSSTRLRSSQPKTMTTKPVTALETPISTETLPIGNHMPSIPIEASRSATPPIKVPTAVPIDDCIVKENLTNETQSSQIAPAEMPIALPLAIASSITGQSTSTTTTSTSISTATTTTTTTTTIVPTTSSCKILSTVQITEVSSTTSQDSQNTLAAISVETYDTPVPLVSGEADSSISHLAPATPCTDDSSVSSVGDDQSIEALPPIVAAPVVADKTTSEHADNTGSRSQHVELFCDMAELSAPSLAEEVIFDTVEVTVTTEEVANEQVVFETVDHVSQLPQTDGGDVPLLPPNELMSLKASAKEDDNTNSNKVLEMVELEKKPETIAHSDQLQSIGSDVMFPVEKSLSRESLLESPIRNTDENDSQPIAAVASSANESVAQTEVITAGRPKNASDAMVCVDKPETIAPLNDLPIRLDPVSPVEIAATTVLDVLEDISTDEEWASEEDEQCAARPMQSEIEIAPLVSPQQNAPSACFPSPPLLPTPDQLMCVPLTSPATVRPIPFAPLHPKTPVPTASPPAPKSLRSLPLPLMSIPVSKPVMTPKEVQKWRPQHKDVRREPLLHQPGPSHHNHFMDICRPDFSNAMHDLAGVRTLQLLSNLIISNAVILDNVAKQNMQNPMCNYTVQKTVHSASETTGEIVGEPKSDNGRGTPLIDEQEEHIDKDDGGNGGSIVTPNLSVLRNLQVDIKSMGALATNSSSRSVHNECGYGRTLQRTYTAKDERSRSSTMLSDTMQRGRGMTERSSSVPNRRVMDSKTATQGSVREDRPECVLKQKQHGQMSLKPIEILQDAKSKPKLVSGDVKPVVCTLRSTGNAVEYASKKNDDADKWSVKSSTLCHNVSGSNSMEMVQQELKPSTKPKEILPPLSVKDKINAQPVAKKPCEMKTTGLKRQKSNTKTINRLDSTPCVPTINPLTLEKTKQNDKNMAQIPKISNFSIENLIKPTTHANKGNRLGKESVTNNSKTINSSNKQRNGIEKPVISQISAKKDTKSVNSSEDIVLAEPIPSATDTCDSIENASLKRHEQTVPTTCNPVSSVEIPNDSNIESKEALSELNANMLFRKSDHSMPKAAAPCDRIDVVTSKNVLTASDASDIAPATIADQLQSSARNASKTVPNKIVCKKSDFRELSLKNPHHSTADPVRIGKNVKSSPKSNDYAKKTCSVLADLKQIHAGSAVSPSLGAIRTFPNARAKKERKETVASQSRQDSQVKINDNTMKIVTKHHSANVSKAMPKNGSHSPVEPSQMEVLLPLSGDTENESCINASKSMPMSNDCFELTSMAGDLVVPIDSVKSDKTCEQMHRSPTVNLAIKSSENHALVCSESLTIDISVSTDLKTRKCIKMADTNVHHSSDKIPNLMEHHTGKDSPIDTASSPMDSSKTFMPDQSIDRLSETFSTDCVEKIQIDSLAPLKMDEKDSSGNSIVLSKPNESAVYLPVKKAPEQSEEKTSQSPNTPDPTVPKKDKLNDKSSKFSSPTIGASKTSIVKNCKTKSNKKSTKCKTVQCTIKLDNMPTPSNCLPNSEQCEPTATLPLRSKTPPTPEPNLAAKQSDDQSTCIETSNVQTVAAPNSPEKQLQPAVISTLRSKTSPTPEPNLAAKQSDDQSTCVKTSNVQTVVAPNSPEKQLQPAVITGPVSLDTPTAQTCLSNSEQQNMDAASQMVKLSLRPVDLEKIPSMLSVKDAIVGSAASLMSYTDPKPETMKTSIDESLLQAVQGALELENSKTADTAERPHYKFDSNVPSDYLKSIAGKRARRNSTTDRLSRSKVGSLMEIAGGGVPATGCTRGAGSLRSRRNSIAVEIKTEARTAVEAKESHCEKYGGVVTSDFRTGSPDSQQTELSEETVIKMVQCSYALAPAIKSILVRSSTMVRRKSIVTFAKELCILPDELRRIDNNDIDAAETSSSQVSPIEIVKISNSQSPTRTQRPVHITAAANTNVQPEEFILPDYCGVEQSVVAQATTEQLSSSIQSVTTDERKPKAGSIRKRGRRDSIAVMAAQKARKNARLSSTGNSDVKCTLTSDKIKSENFVASDVVEVDEKYFSRQLRSNTLVNCQQKNEHLAGATTIDTAGKAVAERSADNANIDQVSAKAECVPKAGKKCMRTESSRFNRYVEISVQTPLVDPKLKKCFVLLKRLVKTEPPQVDGTEVTKVATNCKPEQSKSVCLSGNHEMVKTAKNCRSSEDSHESIGIAALQDSESAVDSIVKPINESFACTQSNVEKELQMMQLELRPCARDDLAKPSSHVAATIPIVVAVNADLQCSVHCESDIAPMPITTEPSLDTVINPTNRDETISDHSTAPSSPIDTVIANEKLQFVKAMLKHRYPSPKRCRSSDIDPADMAAKRTNWTNEIRIYEKYTQQLPVAEARPFNMLTLCNDTVPKERSLATMNVLNIVEVAFIEQCFRSFEIFDPSSVGYLDKLITKCHSEQIVAYEQLEDIEVKYKLLKKTFINENIKGTVQSSTASRLNDIIKISDVFLRKWNAIRCDLFGRDIKAAIAQLETTTTSSSCIDDAAMTCGSATIPIQVMEAKTSEDLTTTPLVDNSKDLEVIITDKFVDLEKILHSNRLEVAAMASLITNATPETIEELNRTRSEALASVELPIDSTIELTTKILTPDSPDLLESLPPLNATTSFDIPKRLPDLDKPLGVPFVYPEMFDANTGENPSAGSSAGKTVEDFGENQNPIDGIDLTALLWPKPTDVYDGTSENEIDYGGILQQLDHDTIDKFSQRVYSLGTDDTVYQKSIKHQDVLISGLNEDYSQPIVMTATSSEATIDSKTLVDVEPSTVQSEPCIIVQKPDYVPPSATDDNWKIYINKDTAVVATQPPTLACTIAQLPAVHQSSNAVVPLPVTVSDATNNKPLPAVVSTPASATIVKHVVSLPVKHAVPLPPVKPITPEKTTGIRNILPVKLRAGKRKNDEFNHTVAKKLKFEPAASKPPTMQPPMNPKPLIAATTTTAATALKRKHTADVYEFVDDNDSSPCKRKPVAHNRKTLNALPCLGGPATVYNNVPQLQEVSQMVNSFGIYDKERNLASIACPALEKPNKPYTTARVVRRHSTYQSAPAHLNVPPREHLRSVPETQQQQPPIISMRRQSTDVRSQPIQIASNNHTHSVQFAKIADISMFNVQPTKPLMAVRPQSSRPHTVPPVAHRSQNVLPTTTTLKRPHTDVPSPTTRPNVVLPTPTVSHRSQTVLSTTLKRPNVFLPTPTQPSPNQPSIHATQSNRAPTFPAPNRPKIVLPSSNRPQVSSSHSQPQATHTQQQQIVRPQARAQLVQNSLSMPVVGTQSTARLHSHGTSSQSVTGLATVQQKQLQGRLSMPTASVRRCSSDRFGSTTSPPSAFHKVEPSVKCSSRSVAKNVQHHQLPTNNHTLMSHQQNHYNSHTGA